MKQWNIYHFEYGSSGLVRKLIYGGLPARSDKAAIDTICKYLGDKVRRGAPFARDAHADDWCTAESDLIGRNGNGETRHEESRTEGRSH